MYETTVKGLSLKVGKKSDVASGIAKAILEINQDGWSHYETIILSTQEVEEYFRVEVMLLFKKYLD